MGRGRAARGVTGLVWFLPGALSPLLLGKAIDSGVLHGDMWATLGWAGVLTLVIVVGAAAGIANHTFVVRGWLIALYGTQKLVTRKAVQLGHVLSRRLPTGDGAEHLQFGLEHVRSDHRDRVPHDRGRCRRSCWSAR